MVPLAHGRAVAEAGRAKEEEVDTAVPSMVQPDPWPSTPKDSFECSLKELEGHVGVGTEHDVDWVAPPVADGELALHGLFDQPARQPV